MRLLKFSCFILIHIVINLSECMTSEGIKSMNENSNKILSHTDNSLPNSLQIKTKNKNKSIDDISNTIKVFQTYSKAGDIPESFKLGFYFFIGLSITGILFILVKINRMRLSRAERKYGVHGDRTTQELTPLPTAIEDDSDNDDHTVFDINKQIRVS